MRKINRKYQKNIYSVISYFCILTMVFSLVFSTPAFAAENQVNEFTVSNGEIIAYTGTASDVVIPDTIDGQTVSAIGVGAFKGKGLTSVKIPDTVKTIGKQAFYSNKLTSAIIPDGVNSIGAQAFTNNALTAINLPEGLTSLGDGAFSGNKLTSVIIPASLEKIPNVAFSKNSLTSVIISEGVTSIGMGAFTINQLESIVIPDSVTLIDKTAFKQNNLKSVVIPKNLKAIGISVFDTNQLESVTIPDGVIKIDDAAFRNNQLQSVIIPGSVETLSTVAFDGNINISLTYTKLVDAIKNAESINTSGKPQENVQALRVAIEEGKVLNSNPRATLEEVNIAVANINKAVEALDFVISNGEITGYTGTEKDIIIPGSINGQIVTSIGASAFKGKSLTSVRIPNTVETIKMQAFYTNNLTSVELPQNLTYMESFAFASNKLNSITIPKSLTNIPSGAFYMNELASVVIPEGVQYISASAFKTNKLGPVTIPTSVISLSNNSFDLNTNVKLTYTKLVDAIKNAENTPTIGKSQRNVDALKAAIEGGKLVNNKSKATLLEVDTAVSNINNAIKALAEESGIKPSIKQIKPLEIIEVGLGTSEADIKTKLPAKITILDSENVEHSVSAAWSISGYNGNLAGEYTAAGAFELPEGVAQSTPAMDLKVTVKIIVKALDNKTWSIKDFTYSGTAITGLSEGGKIKFKTNKNLVLPKFNEFGQAITEIGNKAFLGDYTTKQDPNIGINSVIIPDTVTTIGKEAFRYNCLTSINIPSSVTTIKMSAFNGNRLKSLIIPDSVTNIEGGAFTLNELEYLKLPNGLTTIPTAFAFNNLTSVTIPEGVTRINDLAFSDNRLSEIKLPSTLKYLSGLNNNEFRSITIPKNVTELGYKAFASNWMTSVTIPGNVKVVGKSAFVNTWHDQYLSSVIIEEGVEKIDASAFYSNNLKDVELPRSLKELSNDAFSRNLGYDGIVHLFTPDYKNPNNFEENKNQVINPGKIIIKYVYEDKVLKENEMWKNPATGAYLHIGDKGIEITPEYSDNEHELKSSNPIRVDLNNKENVVIVQCKKKGEAEEIKIKSIGRVAPVVVAFGTNKETAMSRLAKKTFIVDSNNQQHEVELTWKLGEYNGNKSGEYTAIGTFKLPEGIAQSQPITKLEVTVPIIVKAIFENLENSIWKVEDFTYEETTVTGFSELGMEKLKTNKDLVIPKVNRKGESITRIGETAFKNMGLTSVVIPEDLYGLVIEAGAFRENQINRVYIPEGVMEILTFAFYKNELRYVDIPGTVSKIGNQAFAYNKLVSLTVAEGIGKICFDSFSFYKNQLSSVTILKEVLKVHTDAFRDNLGYENDNNKVHVFMTAVNSENNGLFELSNYHRVILLTLESVEKINPIEVDFGTDINNIALPDKIRLKFNNGDIKEANVTWVSEDYDPNKAQEYTFTGYYDLPEGMTAEKPEIKVNVTVKDKVLENNTSVATLVRDNKTKTNLNKVKTNKTKAENTAVIALTETISPENPTTENEVVSSSNEEATSLNTTEKVTEKKNESNKVIYIFTPIALAGIVILAISRRKAS